jgi:hypothetical protein
MVSVSRPQKLGFLPLLLSMMFFGTVIVTVIALNIGTVIVRLIFFGTEIWYLSVHDEH